MRRLSVATAAVIMLTILSVVYPAESAVKWIATFGSDSVHDEGSYIQETPAGGYILVGTHERKAASADVWLIKLDVFGNELWNRTYGDSMLDLGWGLDQTRDCGYILTGSLMHGSPLRTDLWLVKTDSLGTVEWDTAYGGDGNEEGYYVEQTSDSGYIAVGRTYSFVSPGSVGPDLWLLKTNETGDSVWAAIYGDSAFDEAKSGQQTLDGGYVTFGYTSSYSRWGDLDQWLVKTDGLGNMSWMKAVGLDEYDAGHSVRQCADGGYILGGELETAWGRTASLEKRDSGGNPIWSREYGIYQLEAVYSVCPTDDGGVVATGIRGGVGNRGVFLLKVDSLGETEWVRFFEGAWGSSVQQTSDGGFILVGRITVTGYADILVIKTDHLGEIGVEESTVFRPSDPYCLQNTPNPLHHSTVIAYSLPTVTQVTLAIYDITGRLVETLVNETQQPGIHQVRWNKADNPSGVYFYRLKAGEFVETRRMVLID